MSKYFLLLTNYFILIRLFNLRKTGNLRKYSINNLLSFLNSVVAALYFSNKYLEINLDFSYNLR